MSVFIMVPPNASHLPSCLDHWPEDKHEPEVHLGNAELRDEHSCTYKVRTLPVMRRDVIGRPRVTQTFQVLVDHTQILGCLPWRSTESPHLTGVS